MKYAINRIFSSLNIYSFFDNFRWLLRRQARLHSELVLVQLLVHQHKNSVTDHFNQELNTGN